MIDSNGELKFEGSPIFEPLLQPMRYKGVYGGRGSGKSHFFASLAVMECMRVPGTRVLCAREVQKTLKESSKRVIEDKIRHLGLDETDGFKIYEDKIATPGDGLIIFQGMQEYTAESIKSLEGYRIAWVEQAEMLSQTSLDILRPTIRTEGSELWFSWNPRRRTDPVDHFLRANKPENAIVIEANWRDNDFWNKTLDQERLECLQNQPDQYDHIWEGDYQKITSGAYYASSLTAARGSG